MFRWPSTLPLRPNRGSYGEKFPSDIAYQKMSVGPPKARRRSTSGFESLSPVYTMTKLQVDTLTSFFLNGCGAGSLPFEWFHPRLDTYVTAYFTDKAPEISEKEFDQYEVSIEIIIPLKATFLLGDEFWTDLPTGSINNTVMEPGTGNRVVNDPNRIAHIKDGALIFDSLGASLPNWNDPEYYGTGKLITRAAGLATLWEVWLDRNFQGFMGPRANANVEMDIGRNWFFNMSHYRGHITPYIDFGMPLDFYYPPPREQWVAYGVIERTPGSSCCFNLFRTPAGDWVFLNESTAPYSDTTRAFSFTTNAGGLGKLRRVRQVQLGWLPEPIFSDGFGGTFGIPDNKGHYEGVTGGLGQGQSSGVWQNVVGAWTTVGGRARSTSLSNNYAVSLVDVNKLDVLVRCKYWFNGGSWLGLVMNYIDQNNYIGLMASGTNNNFFKVKNGGLTILATQTGITSGGGKVMMLRRGSDNRYYFSIENATGDWFTMPYSDEGFTLGNNDEEYFAQSTKVGIMSYYGNTNEIDDFTVRPCTSPQLNRLNMFI